MKANENGKTYRTQELVETSGILTTKGLLGMLHRWNVRPVSRGRWGEDAYRLCLEYRDTVSTKELLDASPWISLMTLQKKMSEVGVSQKFYGRWPRSALGLFSGMVVSSRGRRGSFAKTLGKAVAPNPSPDEAKPVPLNPVEKNPERLWRVCVLDDCGWWRVVLAGLDLDRAKDNAAEIMSRGKAVMVRPC